MYAFIYFTLLVFKLRQKLFSQNMKKYKGGTILKTLEKCWWQPQVQINFKNKKVPFYSKNNNNNNNIYAAWSNCDPFTVIFSGKHVFQVISWKMIFDVDAPNNPFLSKEEACEHLKFSIFVILDWKKKPSTRPHTWLMLSLRRSKQICYLVTSVLVSSKTL